MSRPLIVCSPVLLLVVLSLAACATGGRPGESYTTHTQRLADDCQARGGILAPTGGQTGRPETDNVCKITGEPSARVRPN